VSQHFKSEYYIREPENTALAVTNPNDTLEKNQNNLNKPSNTNY